MSNKIVTQKLNTTQGDDPIVEGIFYPSDKGFRWQGEYIKVGHYPQIVVKCPFCGKEHLHGWEPGEDGHPPAGGHRVAHCHTGGGYFIREVKR